MHKITLSIFHLIFLLLLATPILAADRHDRAPPSHNRPPPSHNRPQQWHGDIRNFHKHDLGRWSGGHWYSGRHSGRSGWWWIVGPTWYFYSAPVYPYPDPYLPQVVIVAPPVQPEVPPQYWYYCADPAGYYPYVPRCRVNWQTVLPTPP
ncbi:MAG: hypothetical protein WCD07_02195 [Burkholderiales bacterium]